MTQKTHWGATPEEWVLFSETLGLQEFLLPVVSNPEAAKSPESKITTLGKLPSIYNSRRQVAGLKDWPNRTTTEIDLHRWKREADYGFCVRTVGCNAFDIDINDTTFSLAIKEFISGFLGREVPVRTRNNSGKCLIPFVLPKDSAKSGKRVLKCGEHGIIEWLATGQQFVACGTHTSKVRYQWTFPEGPNEVGSTIPEITLGEADRLWNALEEKFATEPSTKARATRQDVIRTLHDTDPIVQYMEDNGMVLDRESDGRVHILCPFATEHTTDGGVMATTYFPPNTGGYSEPGIKCLHAHCSGRRTEDFLEEMNYPMPPMFEDLTFDATKSEPYPEATGNGVIAEMIDSDVAPETKSINEQCDDYIAESRQQIKKNKFTPMNAHEFAKGGFMTSWLIKNVLPKAPVGMIIGPPASGKTFMVLDIAYAIARGIPWRGMKCTQGKVMYMAIEGKEGVKSRIRAYEIKHKLDSTNAPPLFVTPHSLNLANPLHVRDLINAINEIGGIVLLIVDTLSSASPGADENAAEAMSMIMGNCRLINEQTGAGVLLVHHSGKDASKGARGSSAILAAVDYEVQVIRRGEDRSLRINKQRDGSDSAEYGFRLEMVGIGVDEDNELVQSCVIQHSNVLPDKVPLSHGKVEKKVCRVLRNVFIGDGFYPDRNTLLERIVEKYPKMKKANANRAVNSAIKKGLIIELEGLMTDVQPVPEE